MLCSDLLCVINRHGTGTESVMMEEAARSLQCEFNQEQQLTHGELGVLSYGKGSLSYCFNNVFSSRFKCLMRLDLIHEAETFRAPASTVGIGKEFIVSVARVENPLKRILNTLY